MAGLTSLARAAKYEIQRRFSPTSMPNAIQILGWEIEKAAAQGLASVADQAEFKTLQNDSPFEFPLIDELYKQCIKLKTLTSEENPKKIASLKEEYNNCLAKLRAVLEDRVYLDHKDCPNNKNVKFVHALCVAIWHHGDQDTIAYQRFGNKLRAYDPITKLSLLNVKRHSLYKSYWTLGSLYKTMVFAPMHFKKVLSSATSLGGSMEKGIKCFGFSGYDPMGTLSNHPTFHFTDIDKGITTRHIYGPGPTRNGEITPEFRGLLNAIRLNKQARQQHNTYILETPDFLIYTNFQDMLAKAVHGEGDRSRQLMHILNTEYPDVAMGMSLFQDSALFKMKGLNALEMWKNPESFENHMRKHLFDQATYGYENRHVSANRAQRCYLPGGPEAWNKKINSILQEVTQFFSEIRPLPNLSEVNQPQREKQAKGYCIAYQMLVYQILQRVVEQEKGSLLKSQGIQMPLIHAQGSCKEHVDRGGVNSAIHGYLSDRPLEETLGFLYGRPLAACDRMILTHRLEPLILAQYITPHEYLVLLNNVFNRLGITPKLLPEDLLLN